MRDLFEGSSRHEMNASLEIESRLNDVICLVEHFEHRILMVKDQGPRDWVPCLVSEEVLSFDWDLVSFYQSLHSE